MSLSDASDRAVAEALFTKALLALSRIHSGGGGALADAAGYARPNLSLAQQGLRRLPPHVAARFEELLDFGPEGFRSERVEPGLVRHEDHLQALLDVGFTIKPLLQIVSNAEARAIESRRERPLELAGALPPRTETPASADQQFVAVKLAYAGTHRFLVLRGNPSRMRALLTKVEHNFPYVRLPAGLHRELAELKTRSDGNMGPPAARAFEQGLNALDRGSAEVDLFTVQRALIDWIHQESPKFRPPKAAAAPLESALLEALCRLYALTPAHGGCKELFGRLRSGIPTRVKVLTSATEGIELAAQSAEASQLIAVHVVEGPALLFEVVFEGPEALAFPHGSVADFLDLDVLRTQNALVRATQRLTRKHKGGRSSMAPVTLDLAELPSSPLLTEAERLQELIVDLVSGKAASSSAARAVLDAAIEFHVHAIQAFEACFGAGTGWWCLPMLPAERLLPFVTSPLYGDDYRPIVNTSGEGPPEWTSFFHTGGKLACPKPPGTALNVRQAVELYIEERTTQAIKDDASISFVQLAGRLLDGSWVTVYTRLDQANENLQQVHDTLDFPVSTAATRVKRCRPDAWGVWIYEVTSGERILAEYSPVHDAAGRAQLDQAMNAGQVRHYDFSTEVTLRRLRADRHAAALNAAMSHGGDPEQHATRTERNVL